MNKSFSLTGNLLVVEASGGFSGYFRSVCNHPVAILKVVDRAGGTLKIKELLGAGLTVPMVQEMMREQAEELRRIFLPDLDPLALGCYEADGKGSTGFVSICLILHHADETFGKEGSL